MNKTHRSTFTTFVEEVERKNPHEPEFLQAVREVAEAVIPFMQEHPKYLNNNILQRLVEPERVIMFRVPWVDDNKNVQVNRGIRVQFNSAIGPYKGGLRFHPSVNLSVLKFLGFEQVFKNALTTLPLGGAKGGADFDPKGKSDNEVMNFCQSYMSELHRHINKSTDIPAGDIGVGTREIGYLFGQYKRLENEFAGVMTGKDINWGGSLIRPESTGYGTVYFIEEMFKMVDDDLQDKTVIVSGSGNVAQFVIEKISELGGHALTASDSSGFVLVPDGFKQQHLDFMKVLKNQERGRISRMAEEFSDVKYFDNQEVWHACDHLDNIDIAIPCATENELNGDHARKLMENGVKAIGEGSNMPCTEDAVHLFQESDVLFAPGKAANAGGVATSGLEMSQNALRLSWDREKVDDKLRSIMYEVHQQCLKYGKKREGGIDYIKGASIAGFVKVADAMVDQGVV